MVLKLWVIKPQQVGQGGGGGWYETNFIVEFADTIVQCFIKLKFKLDHFLFLKVWGVECDPPPPQLLKGAHQKKKWDNHFPVETQLKDSNVGGMNAKLQC